MVVLKTLNRKKGEYQPRTKREKLKRREDSSLVKVAVEALEAKVSKAARSIAQISKRTLQTHLKVMSRFPI